jgi:aspartyl-tRNA(Asn)/glutamyl-tRNA(Gln) amidotransferase subunit C
MSLDNAAVEKIALLARLAIQPEDVPITTQNLSKILEFVEQMNEVDTKGIEPMAHPMDAKQRLRQDVVTEPNQRELFQNIAPQVESGLYIVPQVIAEE